MHPHTVPDDRFSTSRLETTSASFVLGAYCELRIDGVLRSSRKAPGQLAGCWRTPSNFLPQAPEEIYDTLEQASIAVDVLVNSAGIQVYGALQDTDVAEQLRLIQVNLVALTHLTMLFSRDMVERGRGMAEIRLGGILDRTHSHGPIPMSISVCN